MADGSANLFYADLASPFDSPGYHCRGKSFFFLSLRHSRRRNFPCADFVPGGGKNVTLKSVVVHHAEYAQRDDVAITPYLDASSSSSTFFFLFFPIPKRRQVVAAEIVEFP